MSHTDAAAQTPLTPEHLPDDVATLKLMVVEMAASLKDRDRDLAAARHQVELLLRRLYGPRGERFNPNQLLLFVDQVGGEPTTAPALPEDQATTDQATAPPQRRCRPHGRRRLPDHLPRETVHHELPEATRACPCCGRMRIDIGVDKSEQVEYRPAALRVIEHLVHKYICPGCSNPSPPAPKPQADPSLESAPVPASQAQPEPKPQAAPPSQETPTAPASQDGTARQSAVHEQSSVAGPGSPAPTPAGLVVDPRTIVIAAPKPPMPIAKGLPGPGLLAHLIVSKYVDHLPLYRLERIYERQGLFLPRSTLCDWLAACGQLLQPLYTQLVAVVLQSRALHTDDTPVKLQDPKTHQLSTARLWVYLGDAAHPYNVFDFTVNRRRDGPQKFLENYQGYLHADAFSGYDCLFLPQPSTATARILEVACNAHARRKFYEARSSDVLCSHQALAYYRQLYELERAATVNDFTDSQRFQMRQDLSLLILERFHDWLDQQRLEVLPKSPMGEAIGYALNNWTALKRYTEAGFLDIDNNAAEREMKRIAIGRKNWLFIGSPQGGQTAAVLFSFTSTCQRLGIEPWAYLQDVLTRLPTTPDGQRADLLPDRWQAAQIKSQKAATVAPTPPTPADLPD
jgi:transposase